jgi:autotransporter passenger strand-loop-strand repeat protein
MIYTAPPTQNHLVLHSGDSLNINASGVAFNTANNGGVENVYAGGADVGATINSGRQGAGLENVYGVATDTTIDRGLQYVFSGGTATHTTINNGGQQWVYGIAVDTTINSGGLESVFSGTADNVIFGGAHATLAIVGKPSGLIGDVTNWRVGDVIDFLNTSVTVAHETGNVLTVTYGNQSASYTVVGQQANTEVRLQSDGGGGTELILTPLVGVQHLHHEASHFHMM